MIRRRQLIRYLGLTTASTIAGEAHAEANSAGQRSTSQTATVGSRQIPRGEWPTFQRDTRRSGAVGDDGPVSEIETAWRRSVKSPLYAQPVVADGTVIVSASNQSESDGTLVAVDINGTEQWRRSVPLSILSTPTIRNGTVYHTSSRTVVARALTDGDVEWSIELPTSVFGSPLVTSDAVIIGTRTGELVAVSTGDGELRWRTPLEGIVSGSPAFDGETIVAATDSGAVAAVDHSTGDTVWTRDLGGAIRSPLTVADGSVFVPTGSGALHALAVSTGDQQWTKTERLSTVSSPVVADGTCYWSGGDQVLALDTADGTERWRATTDGYTGLNRVGPSPVATARTVYVTTGQSTVFALDRSDGAERWTFTPPSGAEALSLAVVRGRLYVGTSDGALYALDGRTNYRPEPSFTYAPRTPSPGEQITFDATASTDPDGSVERFRWDFDGDGEFEMHGGTVSRSLPAGEHAIKLEVVDSGGARATTEQTVSVSAGAVTTATDASSDGIAAYVDRVPGDEVGVAGGVAGLLSVLGLTRLRGTEQTEPEDRTDNTPRPTPPASPETAGEDDTRVHPANGRDIEFEDLTIGNSVGNGLLTEVNDATLPTVPDPMVVETLRGSAGHTVHAERFEQFADGIDVWSRIDDHRNVVSVLATGTEPFPWAAIERCSTQLRPEAVADRPFSEIRALLVDVLEGVHHGHRHGLFHGALAPSNVLVVSPDRTAGENSVAAVSDWEVTASQLDPSIDITDTHPRFASPEQIAPERFREPDSLADVYQVGVLAYALTTGSYPFEETANALDERHTDAVVPPSERATGVPDGFDGAVTTALAIEPTERYQTALHFRDALERL